MFTILVVQGNFLFREAVHDALRSHFLFPVVAKAKGVEETLLTIDTMRPDPIFLDIGLPDGNGFERTRRLRTEGIRASIAEFTSHDVPDHRAALGPECGFETATIVNSLRDSRSAELKRRSPQTPAFKGSVDAARFCGGSLVHERPDPVPTVFGSNQLGKHGIGSCWPIADNPSSQYEGGTAA